MIEQGNFYTVEFNNFRRVHRNRAGGEVFCIEIEVSEDDWHHLGSFPQDAIGDAALRWNERAAVEAKPKREPKPKLEPSPYGAFWRELDKTGFHNRPDVREWIGYQGTDEATAKDRLREAIGVTRRSVEGSPERLLSDLRLANQYSSPGYLDGAITAVEQAKVRTELKEAV